MLDGHPKAPDYVIMQQEVLFPKIHTKYDVNVNGGVDDKLISVTV